MPHFGTDIARNQRLHFLPMAPGVTCDQTLQEGMTEYGVIEREIYVEAAPEIVFEV